MSSTRASRCTNTATSRRGEPDRAIGVGRRAAPTHGRRAAWSCGSAHHQKRSVVYDRDWPERGVLVHHFLSVLEARGVLTSSTLDTLTVDRLGRRAESAVGNGGLSAQ